MPVGLATHRADRAAPGIGKVRAEAIVRYRTDNGPFTTVEDLGKVPGIGPSTLNGIRNLVSVGD